MLLTLSSSTHLLTLSPIWKKERKRHFEGTLARKSTLYHQDVLLIETLSLLKLSLFRIIRKLKFGPPLTRVWNKTWIYQFKQLYNGVTFAKWNCFAMLLTHYSLPGAPQFRDYLIKTLPGPIQNSENSSTNYLLHCHRTDHRS